MGRRQRAARDLLHLFLLVGGRYGMKCYFTCWPPPSALTDKTSAVFVNSRGARCLEPDHSLSEARKYQAVISSRVLLHVCLALESGACFAVPGATQTDAFQPGANITWHLFAKMIVESNRTKRPELGLLDLKIAT